jgi:protease-4
LRQARLRAAGALLALVGLALGCEGRSQSKGGEPAPPRRGPKLAVIDLAVGAPEIEESGFFGPPPGRRRSFDGLLHAVSHARKDADTKGVFVRFGMAQMGLGRAQELATELERVRREMNKPVFCQAEELGNATYMVASRGCSKIYLAPGGSVETVGLAAQLVYMRRLLADELHLSIDILQVGKFKGAEEPLTRDGPSPEARASLEGMLGDLRVQWLDGVRAGRGEGVVAAAEDGPYSAPRAKERGLVDEIDYTDVAREAAKAACGAKREEVVFGPGASAGSGEDLDGLLRTLAGGDSAGATVGLIRAVGEISMGEGGPFGGGGITERALSRDIQRATRNDSIKAVVLRIDSPGGSALASDLLWHDLMKLRAKKPLVISIGEMAASGGYYLASTGNEIFADPTSMIGSIGVVGGKISVGTTLDKIGVHAETFPAKSGDVGAMHRAAYGSPLLEWDDGTRARVRQGMEDFYTLFLARIAEGRKTTPDKIAPSAEGRMFSGRQALERGLVDRLDGLLPALRRARELAKLPEDAKVTVLLGRPKLADMLGGGDDDGDTEDRAPALAQLAGADPTAVLQRIAPDLLPYARGWGGLVAGEHVLAFLPYALTVR